jgi:hypothetical protein
VVEANPSQETSDRAEFDNGWTARKLDAKKYVTKHFGAQDRGEATLAPRTAQMARATACSRQM